MSIIPVVLFAYARPAHLAQVLVCLRQNKVPLIYAFADGARSGADEVAVKETRAMLKAVDWTEVRLVERSENYGLGRNVRAGITEVAARHAAFVVWEDDLICVPGTYAWICAALRHYAGEQRVMSVTAWTHPRITPPDIASQPYFDGRAECWVWGTYARSWSGMEQTALEKIAALTARNIDPAAYGADLPVMAREERRKNIWAVRWLYHHLQHAGLCLRPPGSMVEHVGFDANATNAVAAEEWANPLLRSIPVGGSDWPQPREHPAVAALWRQANPAGSGRLDRARARLIVVRSALRTRLRAVVPERIVRRFYRVRWTGNYSSWAEAKAASVGYDAAAILARVIEATRKVRDGRAAFERDGVTFAKPEINGPLVGALEDASQGAGGRLAVLDFGGALGSVYWQHRSWLGASPAVRWVVVEQPHFVAAGRREFSGDTLTFAASVEEAVAQIKPNVLLLSSVLPYLDDPHAFLRSVLVHRFTHVWIDRTGVVDGVPDRLTVQQVPRIIYPGSYPCWFFNREKLLAHFAADYDLIGEHDSGDGEADGLRFKGFHFRRRGA